jgi:hypothetical protein
MWTLACDKDCLGGKRQWLRPGSESFLGRTSGKSEGNDGRCIRDKSVSRSHLIIRVDGIEAGDATRLDKRQCIQLEDKSKSGTTIDGERIMGSAIVLQPGDHTVVLGRHDAVFHLRWQPVVISITNLSKSAKQSSDPLSAQRHLLEQAGVKLSTSYISNVTTHVIAKKRNTAMGLQALLQARWLVTDAFVTALSLVCDRQEGLNSEGLSYRSRMEEDLDAAWPAEEDYIVPIGDEPVKRANELLRPRIERCNVFLDMTFVFISQAQYDTLLPVITSGGGKAALCQYYPDATTFQEVVEFIAKLVGRHGDPNFKLDQSPSSESIVVVRIGDLESGRNAAFMWDLDLALEQRSIEQNEFFAAVLDNNASMLRQGLRDASVSVEPSTATRRTAAATSQLQTSREMDAPERDEQDPPTSQTVEAEEVAPPPPKKRARRIVTQSRFKGFDDFDPSQIVREDSSSPQPEDVSRPPEASVAIDAGHEPDNSEANNRKRKAPAEVARDEDRALLDELLPGAAALKRRRTEALKSGVKDIFARPSSTEVAAETQSKTKTKKSFLQKDIKAEIRKRREKEEEERRKDEEAMHTALDVDINDLKDLAKVETFDLPVRALPPRNAEADRTGPNWNPAWNGRKNFKKFRPQGQRRFEKNGPVQPTRVLVGLEEVPGRGSRSGDDYWLLSNSSARSKSKSQSQSQPQSHPRGTSSTLRHEESAADDSRVADDALASRQDLQRSRGEDAEPGDPNDLSVGQSSRMSGRVPDSMPTNTNTLDARKVSKKRPATRPLIDEPTTKRSRPGGRLLMVVSDEEEEPLAFRRTRRPK